MLQNILETYGFNNISQCTPFGNGLINHTWKVVIKENVYVLQKINQQVFQTPWAIDKNINALRNYLSAHHPHYVFPTPLPNLTGETLVHDKDSYYRLIPFVKDSHSLDVVTSAKQAYEAAKAFGKFTHLLAGFDASQLHITLQNFHDLYLRYQQFEQAVTEGNAERKEQATALIQELQAQQSIALEYKAICSSADFKLRVTHHDTKISNVLFDKEDNSLCVIDLDTVMPGYFISDVGDMMRTYLSPVSEEEKDLSLIEIREEYFKAIISGYLYEMKEELTQTEKEHFVYAGKFMIYMQALRFLTDYLNNDVYYGATYPEQNLVRAKNQACLLQLLNGKEDKLQALVMKTLQNATSTTIL